MFLPTLAVFSIGIDTGIASAQSCEAGKNDSVGRYYGCLGKARKSFIASADALKYQVARDKCVAIFSESWSNLETAGGCPTTSDYADIKAFMDACELSMATAISGAESLILDRTNCLEQLTYASEGLASCQADLPVCEDALAPVASDLAACEASLASCVSLCPSSVRPPMRTGQTTCYDTVGPIPCAGTGQDGELQLGAAQSLTDNGDGTITDSTTGLMWEKLTDDGSIHDWDNAYTRQNAIDVKIAALNAANFAGYNDWRLPNRPELKTIVNLGTAAPAAFSTFHAACVPSCDGTSCGCTKSSTYWSSTNDVHNSFYQWAWTIDFSSGEDEYLSTGLPYFVRAVRGG